MKGKIIISLLIVILLSFGCANKPDNSMTGPGKISHAYQFTLTKGGEPALNASVIVILADGSDTLIQADQRGQVSFETSSEVKAAAGVSFGFSGEKLINGDGQISIVLNPVDNSLAASKSSAASYVFGVYDTDGNGDVRFRYRYNFAYYYCSKGLPSWIGDPNPNNWVSWNIQDFPYPWLGKKLLVPRRYQYWCQYVYGISISHFLLLVSNT